MMVLAASHAGAQTVVNSGVPGRNSSEGLRDLPKVLESPADHLVILFGMNDALNSAKLVEPKKFRQNLQKMIDLSRKQGAKTVTLVTLHPVNESYLQERHPKHPAFGRLQEHVQEYNQAIQEVAQESDCLLVDWRTELLRKSPGETVEDAVADRQESLLRGTENSDDRDGLHLTAKGYQLLAAAVEKRLREHLAPDDKIVCFGDSLTFGSHMHGEGTTHGDTYPAALQRLLKPEE